MKAIGKIAVDSNAVVAYRAGTPEVCRLIKEAEIIFLPSPVFGELLYGVLNSGRILENCEAFYRFSAYATFVPIDENITARYASVRYNLKKRGRPLPENDIWIAAICLELDVPLLTRDAHFENIQGLKIINWMEIKTSL